MLPISTISRRNNYHRTIAEIQAWRIDSEIGPLLPEDCISLDTIDETASSFVNNLGLKLSNKPFDGKQFSRDYTAYILIKPYRTQEINLWESIFSHAADFIETLTIGLIYLNNCEPYLNDRTRDIAKLITLGQLFIKDFPRIQTTKKPRFSKIETPLLSEFQKIAKRFSNDSLIRLSYENDFYNFFFNWSMSMPLNNVYSSLGSNFNPNFTYFDIDYANIFNIPLIFLPLNQKFDAIDIKSIIVHYNNKYYNCESDFLKEKLPVTFTKLTIPPITYNLDELQKKFFLNFKEVMLGNLTFDDIIKKLKDEIDFEVGFV